MANDNNIKIFSAVDIEKYHKGLLSAKEMHAMEMAAMEDPFLADALEGYAVAGVNAELDIIELKKRLAKKTEEAKVIPMVTAPNKNFPWLKVAAAVVIILVSALLANQFLFTNKSPEQNIAKAETQPAKVEEFKAIDSLTPPASGTVAAEEKKVLNSEKQIENDYKTLTDNSKNELKTNNEVVAGNVTEKDKIAPGSETKTAPVTISNAPKTNTEIVRNDNADLNKPVQRDIVKNTAKEKKDDLAKKESGYSDVAASRVATSQDEDAKKSRSLEISRKAEEQNRNASNTFRGRITDASNIGVPFANVTNQQDNVGTYTDSKGYFNLTSPDSVLNVQVRSIGFENSNAQLRNNVSTNQVVLQDDKSLSEVVINQQKPNAEKRSREQNIKMEESEPADGWSNYDAYLANNLKAPEDFKTKKSNTNTQGSVEVSFEIGKNGEPTNFKIEKSLCSKCDKEAIRLIKEGPKWKKPDSKKGRTSVIIKF